MRRALLSALLSLLALVFMAPSPATASSLPWNGHSYRKWADWHIDGFGCVRTIVTGSVQVQHRYYYDPYNGTTHYETHGPRIVHPREQVYFTPGKCSNYGPYTHYPHATKLTMVHLYYASSCSSSWSIGASYPWGVSVSMTPDCSKVKTLRRSTTYGGGHTYDQQNSGVVGVFDHWSNSATNYPKNCARLSTSLTVYQKIPGGQRSHNKRIGLGQVCA